MAEKELNVITTAIKKFTKHLQKEFTKQDVNYLFSPISIHAFLTLLSQDPWFYNKDIFNKALRLHANNTSAHYKDIFEVLSHVNNLLIANTCFLQPSQVVETFRNRLRDNFASEVNFLDFTKPEDATATVNAWVHDKTVEKITPFGGLKDDVNCTFLNATHFRSNWAEPFSADKTIPGTFYLNEHSTVRVQMMRKRGEFYFDNYAALNAKILKLPFVCNNVSLVLILPNQGKNIKEFMQRFSYNSILTRFIKNMGKQEVDVSLPKFKIEETLELGQYLRKMGLEDVFNANLNGVIDDEELTCDEVQQRAYLEVNEEGAEVVAGTVLTLIKAHDEEIISKDGLIIYEENISSEISNRFAKTKVVWRVKNTNEKAADAHFKVILTDTAFITEFVMEIEGKSYKSYIEEKKEAENIYNEAVARGQSAGLVEAKTRNSKEFTVSVNLEPDSMAVFSLTYEEMLQRVHDHYELVLNICPGQIIDDLNIEVHINESQPLKFVKTPSLRSGDGISIAENVQHLDPLSDIKIINSKTASIKFCPNAARQRKLTHYLGNKGRDGLSGQFVVQYDVEREPLNGEVLLQDGYFIHFFAPNDLDPLPKHIVFVLDTSGSMRGKKIKQVKDAMMNIMSDLRKGDMLSIIEFNKDVIVWDIDSKKSTTVPEDKIKDFKEPFSYLEQCLLADPQLVSDTIIKKAKEVVQKIVAHKSTFMIGGLETALYLVKVGQQKNKDIAQRPQPIIVFLTDGEPNVGIHSKDEIVELVTHLNVKDKTPIFSLSFGNSVDKDFLRTLSLKNLGFSRHIYQAADASLQLQEFYKQISSPLLHDIKFKYDAEVEEVTRTCFPIYFRGSELVVAGRCGEQTFPTTVNCCGSHGCIVITSATNKPVTSLERLWAYLTVKQLLNERDSAQNSEELTRKAIHLALAYSFVTDVTSLVVVKPTNSLSTVKIRVTDIDIAKLLLYPEVQCCAIPSGNRKRKGVMEFNSDPGKKPLEEFTADHPFLIFLQVEMDDTVLILFQSCVYNSSV